MKRKCKQNSLKCISMFFLVGMMYCTSSAFTSTRTLKTNSRITTHLQMGDFTPLATEGDWVAYQDTETTGLIYYFNGQSGESLWEPPTASFPKVKLNREQAALMNEKQAGLGVAVAEPVEKKGSLFGKFFSGKATDYTGEEYVEQKYAEEEYVDEGTPSQRKLFGFLARTRKGQEQATEELLEFPEDEGAVETKSSSFTLPNFFSASTKGKTLAVEEPPVLEEEPEQQPKTPPSKSIDFLSPFRSKPTVKQEEIIVPSDTPLKFRVHSQVLPHPDKVSWGGEDALFCAGRTFGVFDGVSGADKLDGVPLYSVTLSEQMQTLVGGDGLTMDGIIDCMCQAAEYADAAATGASTALVASIGEDGFLRALNLGDSTLLVLRYNEIVARTKDILHYFDCPYQLAEDSPDQPKDGTRLIMELCPGDIIIMGSDGIFDNLSDDDVVDIIARTPPRTPVLTKTIVETSRRLSLDVTAPTPYAVLAKKNRYAEYKEGVGGKVDDISCIVLQCV